MQDLYNNVDTVLAVGGLMAAMAIGVIFTNKSLRGSCGGDCLCDPGNARTCPRRPAAKKETTREGRAA